MVITQLIICKLAIEFDDNRCFFCIQTSAIIGRQDTTKLKLNDDVCQNFFIDLAISQDKLLLILCSFNVELEKKIKWLKKRLPFDRKKIKMKKKDKNVALVLSGGAARGLAHIGVIEELMAQGYHIHSIAGTSMGALVGGVYALGKLEEFKSWMLSLDKVQIIKLLDFTLSSPGIIKGKKILDKMKSFIPDKDIESLDIRYSAIATDITKDATHVFRSGDIYEAIRASISIPALFTPVEKGELLLVDGGLVNNIPLNHVERLPSDILVGSYVNARIPVLDKYRIVNKSDKQGTQSRSKHAEFQKYLKKHLKKEKKEKMGYFELIYKSMFLPVGKVSSMRIKQTPPDVLIQVPHEICGLFDFLQAEKLIEIGREITKEQLRKYQIEPV